VRNAPNATKRRFSRTKSGCRDALGRDGWCLKATLTLQGKQKVPVDTSVLAEDGEFGEDDTVVLLNTGTANQDADVLRSHLMSKGV
jgi:hypothetical protein